MSVTKVPSILPLSLRIWSLFIWFHNLTTIILAMIMALESFNIHSKLYHVVFDSDVACKTSLTWIWTISIITASKMYHTMFWQHTGSPEDESGVLLKCLVYFICNNDGNSSKACQWCLVFIVSEHQYCHNWTWRLVPYNSSEQLDWYVRQSTH